MSNPKLTYFDISGSRGEEIRLALAIAGVPFDDDRIDRETFGRIKAELPFASLPVFEIPGKGTFGQSNAILRLIGRQHDLHPEDPFEAARHDALMDAVEDLRARISPSMHMRDEAARKTARQELANDYIPQWAKCIERQLGEGPFVGGDRPSVADIKLYMVHKWISQGILDGLPKDLFAPYPKVARVAQSIGNHPAVVAWYAKPAEARA
jgi:glutathione S-transferase